MGHLGPRKVYPHNSGSSVGITLQFYTMKGAKRGMEIILLVFLKKNLIQAIWLYWPKICTSS